MQAPRELALGGAGRPDEQGMLTGERREQRQAYLPAAFDQPMLERIENLGQPRPERE